MRTARQSALHVLAMILLATAPAQATQTMIRVYWRITGLTIHTPPPVIQNVQRLPPPLSPEPLDEKPPIDFLFRVTSGETGGTFTVNMATNVGDFAAESTRTVYQGSFSPTGTNDLSVSEPVSVGVVIPHVNAVELIPGGPFEMGNAHPDDWNVSPTELPVHTVTVHAFWMDRSKKIRSEWDNVATWANSHGYNLPLLTAPDYSDANLPAFVTWGEAVQWCNARSEWDNLTPCYYTTPQQTEVIRSADPSTISNACVRWHANGWRLPTEAEWERAARGGLRGARFPWGETITHANANYNSLYPSAAMPYDLGPYSGMDSNWPGYSSPWAGFTRNGYGLIDMAGNAEEMCWDFFDPAWYSKPGATSLNTRGPDGPPEGLDPFRVMRNGGYYSMACTIRTSNRATVTYTNQRAFRTVRRL